MENIQASWIDSLIVVVYIVLTLAVGLAAVRFSRKGSRLNEEEFYLGGRRVPAWMNGVSFGVTAINSDVAPAYCGMAAVVGLSVSWFYVPRFGLGLMIAALLFAARWRSLGVMTGPQFASIRYGGKSATMIRVFSSMFSVIIGMVPWIGAGILGVHMIFKPVFGIESEWTTIALVVIPVLIYVWIAGYAGVLFTDVLQTGVIILASFFMIGAVLWHFGGAQGLVDAINAGRPDKAAEMLSSTPVSGHRVLNPLLVMLWFLVPAIGFGGSVALDGQRLFSCKNSKEAAKSLVWGYAVLTVMLLALTLPAMGVLALRPEMYDASPGEREEAYGIMLGFFLPTGALGLTLAAALASVMSTISGHLNYASMTMVNDVYRPLLGEPGARMATWIGRLFTLFIVGLAVCVVYFSESLIGIAITVAGLVGAAASFGWGQWWWWRANVWGWCAATFGGPLVYVSLGLFLRNWQWWQENWAIPSPDSAGLLHAAAGIVITTTLWISVCLFTPPTERHHLLAFYRAARPMGLWGPVRKQVLEEDGAASVAPRGGIIAAIGVALVGVTMIAALIVGLSELFIGRYGDALLYGLLSAAAGLLFKKLFNWHMNRIDPDRLKRNAAVGDGSA